MRFFYIFLFVFAFVGCSITQTPTKSQSVAILIKNANLKINDVGFIHLYSNFAQIQIYNSGKDILNLKIKENICINNACEPPLKFNKMFFQNEYYANLLSDIIKFEPIFDGANLNKTNCGFVQNISKFGIKYEICENQLSFSDPKTKIKLSIMD